MPSCWRSASRRSEPPIVPINGIPDCSEVPRHGPAFCGRAGRVVRDHSARLPVPGEHHVGGRRAPARELRRQPDPPTSGRRCCRRPHAASGGTATCRPPSSRRRPRTVFLADLRTRRSAAAGAGADAPSAPACRALPPLRRLDLTDEQREQVRTAIGESREAARTHARETRTARQALAEAVTTGAVDEDRLRTLGAERGRLAGDAAVGRAQVYTTVCQVLTPEQQARAEEISDK